MNPNLSRLIAAALHAAPSVSPARRAEAARLAGSATSVAELPEWLRTLTGSVTIRALPAGLDDEFEPDFEGPELDLDRQWLPGEAQAWAADDVAGHLRAAGNAEALHRYWTAGPGLAKWRGSPTPWRTLRRFLSKYLSGEKLDSTVSAWYRDVFGHLPHEKLRGGR